MNTAIVEIRAGAGGDEAGLFASQLQRMYSQYAKSQSWQVNVLSKNEGELGNLKAVCLEIEGQDAYKLLKNESGVHRVQRVPHTEKAGRIHTSTASVVVLPKTLPIELKIKPQNLKIDTYRSGGKGGQNVNKLETAVRITHIPTGMVSTCQMERSQAQNRDRALDMLKAKLYEAMRDQKKESLDQIRREQIGTGGRSDKIRTYNFARDQVKDHRIKKSFYGMEKILGGDIGKILQALSNF